jgi:hypothetical protein
MGRFIAGGYSLTYNSKALGQTADGIRMTYEVFKRMVTGHLAGQTPQDAIYQGQNRTSEFRLIEADEAGILDLLYAYTATIGNEWQLGVLGLLDVRGQGGSSPAARAKSLLLTAVTGTSAANDAAATITLPHSSLHDRYPVSVLLAPDLKEVPIRLQHYVDMDAVGGPVFGSST